MQQERTFKADSGLAAFVFYTLFGGAFGAGIGFFAWKLVTDPGEVDNPVIAWIVLAVMSLVPLLFIGLIFKLLRERIRFGRAQAQVTAFPQHGQAELQAHVILPRRGNAMRWEASLRCRSYHTSGSGKNSRTEYSTLWEETASTSASQYDSGVVMDIRLEVPEHLPPTRRGSRSGIKWDIVVKAMDMSGGELMEQEIPLPIERPAIERQSSFSADEIRKDRDVSDGRGVVTDQEMQLRDSSVIFSEGLWESATNRRKGVMALGLFTLVSLGVLGAMSYDNPKAILVGIAGMPIPALFLFLRIRLGKTFGKFAQLLIFAAFFGSAWFGVPSAFFIAAFGGILLPLLLIFAFGSSAFDLELSERGIRIRPRSRLWVGKRELAWSDIRGFRVTDKDRLSLRKKRSDSDRRFTVMAEAGPMPAKLSPPFEDADDALRLLEWLERVGRRYGYEGAGNR